jgi:hypothetical protein
MKTIVILTFAGLLQARKPHCDCTIIPFKPDPPCFQQCVTTITSQASYAELTGKYGVPSNIATRIINARQRDPFGWYTKALNGSERSEVEAIFRTKPDYLERNRKP